MLGVRACGVSAFLSAFGGSAVGSNVAPLEIAMSKIIDGGFVSQIGDAAQWREMYFELFDSTIPYVKKAELADAYQERGDAALEIVSLLEQKIERLQKAHERELQALRETHIQDTYDMLLKLGFQPELDS